MSTFGWSYPPGCANGGYRDYGEVRHRCPKCKHEWDAAMFEELGGMFYRRDEEAYCPTQRKLPSGALTRCGEEGEFAK